MFVTDAYNKQQLPDALLEQIKDKVEPFVLEDVNLTETDIEKIPKGSEMYYLRFFRPLPKGRLCYNDNLIERSNP